MPSITTTDFDGDGRATRGSGDNQQIAASVTRNYLVYNHSGSPVVCFINSSNVLFAHIVRHGGHISETVPNEGEFSINADETIILQMENTSNANQLWRIGAARTEHGLSLKPGTGHTAIASQQPPGIYYGLIT